MEIKLKAVRVLEKIVNADGKVKYGRILYRKKFNDILALDDFEHLKEHLAKRYNVPTWFVCCDFKEITS